MAQWSQGLPLGSTEHCFSFSKNSTNSDTAASSTPNLSWLGCSAEYGERADCGLVSGLDRANGARRARLLNALDPDYSFPCNETVSLLVFTKDRCDLLRL